MSKLETITVGGVDIDVFIKSGGIFYARYRDVEYEAPSLDQLKRQVQAAGKIKLEIPFTALNEGDRWGSRADRKPTARHGVAIGRHSGNGNVLVKMDGAKTSEQGSGYGGRDVARLSDADVDEWKRLVGAKNDAEAALEAWQEAHKIDLRKMVDDALQAAAGEPAAAAPSGRRRRR